MDGRAKPQKPGDLSYESLVYGLIAGEKFRKNPNTKASNPEGLNPKRGRLLVECDIVASLREPQSQGAPIDPNHKP
jgi:hypothetical protein